MITQRHHNMKNNTSDTNLFSHNEKNEQMEEKSNGRRSEINHRNIQTQYERMFGKKLGS